MFATSYSRSSPHLLRTHSRSISRASCSPTTAHLTMAFKMLTIFTCAILALGAVAAPPVFVPADTLTVEGTPIRRTPTPVNASKAQPRDARCTDGMPASEQHHSDYPIKDYTKVEPQTSMVSYEVRKDWYDAHWVSGPHVSALSCILCALLPRCYLSGWCGD